MRLLIASLATMALVLSAVGTAAAGTIRIPIPAVEYDDPFVCDGSPVIHVSYSAPFKLVMWTDADGNIVRDATFAPRSRVILTDVETGRSLSGISPAVFRTTYADDGSVLALRVTGLDAAITIPGQGRVLLETGVIEWSGGFLGPVLAEHGPHGWFGSDDHEAFCNYFRS